MSEVIYTKCDGCSVVLNVDPGVALGLHGWMTDDYDNHFCPACQQNASDLEAQTATPEEMGALVEGIEKAVEQTVRPLKLKKR